VVVVEDGVVDVEVVEIVVVVVISQSTYSGQLQMSILESK